MQLHKFLVITLIYGIYGCGGSSSNSPIKEENTQNENSSTPPIIIDDITCNVSYPLSISTVYQETENKSLTALFDSNKTNSSSWQAPKLDSEIIVELTKPASLKELVITWQDMDVSHLYNVSASKNKEDWQLLVNQGQSQKESLVPDVINLTDYSSATGLYLKLTLTGTEFSQPSELIEIEVFGCEKDVSHSVELIDWYLSVPTDEDNNGKSDSIKEQDLANGYFDPRFFSLSTDGGLIFSTSVSGYRTSTNTKYVRSELREMLRRGDTSHKTQGVNKNNWVFSTAPQTDIDNAGGVDGGLQVNVAVNHVTTTGEDYQIGRVIIGQIHANDDEPARLYYRKLPSNTHGAVYLAHELLNGEDTYYEIIGSRSNNASNPTNGIPLNEKFSYTIDVKGHVLIVSIVKADGNKFVQSIDMSESGYDQGGQYMYFKAGVYNQNNSGDPHDYVRATFYQIQNSHTGYIYSNNQSREQL